MKPTHYLVVFLIPLLVALGLVHGGLWIWLGPFVVFCLVPLAELVLPAPIDNPSEEEAVARLQDWRFDAVICAAVAVQFLLLVLFLASVSSGRLQGFELVGAILAMGLSCGGIGINVGHELGHRRGQTERFWAKLLLCTSLYGHFYIEHNRGHHARVATEGDPATSRKGETVYAFWIRSVTGGWISAWRLEAERLGRRGQRLLSLKNEMLRLQVGQGLLLAVFWAGFGPIAMLAFMGAAGAGILILETVNYLEHYGLQRRRNEKGRLERVQPAHSWNSNGVLGRLLLFELTRHSDHHAHPGRPFPVLRHFDEAPQLPTGYPGMIVVALVPPLFFALMDPRLPRATPDLSSQAA